MAWTIPWQILGLQVSGDVGGYTIYTDRFQRKVIFSKLPPEKPHTAAQARGRNRFAAAQKAWSELSDQVKLDLENMSKKLSLPMTGQNVYISVAMRNTQPALDTLADQSGIPMPTVPYIV